MMRYEDIADATYEQSRVQSLTAQTPNGLPGIPVESNGNYIDVNGKQWVCDEVDFTKGVYIKRVNTVDMGSLTYNYNTDAHRFTSDVSSMKYKKGEAQPVLATCYTSQYNKGYAVKINAISTFSNYPKTILMGDSRTVSGEELKELLTGEKLLYILANPTETPLSAAELAAYASLHTNKPNTTVLSDAAVHMELEYNADTKLYIDNKFAELQNAILASNQTP
jgi:hypothetical protein